MQRLSPPARRFHAACYRWATSTSEPAARTLHSRKSFKHGFPPTIRRHDEAAPHRRIPGQSSFHTDGRSASKSSARARRQRGVRDDEPAFDHVPKAAIHREEKRSPVPIRRFALVLGEGQESQEKQREYTTPPTATHIPNAFKDDTVQSPFAKPFSTLEPQAFVIRYRSASSLMLEVAMPEEALHDHEQRYGKGLQDIRGARVEVQRDVVSIVGGQKLVSVLLSGTYDEVTITWTILWTNNPRVHATESVFSRSERPSETLHPLEWVYRMSKPNGNASLELSVSEKQWMKFVAAHDLDGIAQDTQTRIYVTEPSMRPVSTNSERLELARSFSINGKRPNVAQAHDKIYLAIQPATSSIGSEQKSGGRGVEEVNEDSAPVTGCWFDITGPAGSKVVKALMADNGAMLDEVKCRTGCQSFRKLNSPSDIFEAKGTLSQVAAVRDILAQRVPSICNELGLSPHEVKMLRKHPNDRQGNMIEGGPQTDDEVRDQVRMAFRAQSHSVVVITSIEPNKSQHFHEKLRHFRAVTVSSFNTVTLHPRPIISFNLKVPSRSWDVIRRSKRLRVHLLAATPGGAEIASVFTQPYEHAYDGFRRLIQMGVFVYAQKRAFPPRFFRHGDVLGAINCNLLLDQCIQIGDHFIVVAEAEKCYLEGQAGQEAAKLTAGLSYANGTYQAAGVPIKPPALPDLAREEDLKQEIESAMRSRQDNTIDPELDPLALGEPPKQRPHDINRPLKYSGSTRKSSRRDEHSHMEADSDPIYAALRATSDAEKSGRSLRNEPLSREVEEEQDDYDYGFGSTSQADETSPSDNSRDTSGALWGPEDVTREYSERLAENAAPRVPSNHVPEFSNAGSKRPYSNYTRRMIRGQLVGLREFSTMSTVRSPSEVKPAQVDPSARNMTVADFFGVPDEGYARRPRVDGLIRAKQNASSAERRLAENPNLPEEEKVRLQHQIQIADRKISKRLAWNAALDLRVMLDKGKVDFKRAQFLESAIEKGQATLLDDARQVRELLNQGKIDLEKFNVIKKQLEQTSEVLTTEAMRLRQVADEENDSFEGAAGDEDPHRAFDGFRGNR